jgi:hypothetical protein
MIAYYCRISVFNHKNTSVIQERLKGFLFVTAERYSHFRVGLVGLLLMVGSILYILLPFTALRWAQTPFLGFFVDPNLVINDSGELSWPSQGDNPLVSYPDRITAIDNQPVTTIDAISGHP